MTILQHTRLPSRFSLEQHGASDSKPCNYSFKLCARGAQDGADTAAPTRPERVQDGPKCRLKAVLAVFWGAHACMWTRSGCMWSLIGAHVGPTMSMRTIVSRQGDLLPPTPPPSLSFSLTLNRCSSLVSNASDTPISMRTAFIPEDDLLLPACPPRINFHANLIPSHSLST
jgi:hypothetical protein